VEAIVVGGIDESDVGEKERQEVGQSFAWPLYSCQEGFRQRGVQRREGRGRERNRQREADSDRTSGGAKGSTDKRRFARAKSNSGNPIFLVCNAELRR
jgi:hypothetical protein